ncbi:conserved hypothetical protein [Frankia canadensis]|uniref:Uncharacterized protein n=1 Tax=Frankia canadensis TaxID=1836972 RepID=A0A2I2KWB6_9ACTN|nr:conserved hypothetical protein [Frankia canadensis]SOU57267.1 conserved hypothetical protein [Frankia canadensis]
MMADQRRGVDSAPIRAARSLIRSAPYASLALWGGRVVHGLRFVTTVESLPGAFSGPVVVHGHPGVSPAHPVVGSSTAPELSPMSSVVDGTTALEAAHLLLLVPTAAGAWPQSDDMAARVNMSGSEPSTRRWVSVALGGWVASLPPEFCRAAAVLFAERHPTPDLFDLGTGWTILRMEIAEAVVRTDRVCALLDTEESIGLLAGEPRD